MAWSIDEIVTGLTSPVILFGHFTYFLLIISMLMRRMVWLRSFAVASGLAKIVYRVWFVVDPVSVLWEAIFVLVNVIQLLLTGTTSDTTPSQTTSGTSPIPSRPASSAA